MLEKIGGFMSEIGRIVRASHERWDGGGYPDGLSGETIPLESRIVATCDAFNAMTTTRSYRTAMSLADAAAELQRCAGSQFDPGVVRALLGFVAVSSPGRADGLSERSRANGFAPQADKPADIALSGVTAQSPRSADAQRAEAPVSRASRVARRAPRRVA
jgi:HD-GYP domain-containing protein (c-di-GMP phosphodiesterase class II)